MRKAGVLTILVCLLAAIHTVSADTSGNAVNQIFTDYGVNSNTYTTLMLDTWNYYDVRSQVIFHQNDLGPAQTITDLAIHVYQSPGMASNWTIRMQHTNWAEYPDTYAVTQMVLPSGWTTVFQSNIAFSNTGWVNFHFDTPFDFNGTQNLLIDFSYNNTTRVSPYGAYFVHDSGMNQVLTLASSTGTHDDPLNWNFWSLGGNYFLNDYVPSMKFIGTVPEPATLLLVAIGGMMIRRKK